MSQYLGLFSIHMVVVRLIFKLRSFALLPALFNVLRRLSIKRTVLGFSAYRIPGPYRVPFPG